MVVVSVASSIICLLLLLVLFIHSTIQPESHMAEEVTADRKKFFDVPSGRESGSG
jgi:hypothetical protein